MGYGLCVIKTMCRHPPSYSLTLQWTGGERYRGLIISVDLSLAVKINSRSSTVVSKTRNGVTGNGVTA